MLLFPAGQFLFAQEVLSPAGFNRAIGIKNLQNASWNKMQSWVTDTISLPLADDFSKEGIYPDTAYWLGTSVFINTDYPVHPPTIGVATFDGVDSLGQPYDSSNVYAYGVADYLTSRPLRLDSFGGNKMTPADSVYLSFFYQPQGRGNAPDPDDSLVLEFRVNDTAWTHIWSIPGKAVGPDSSFTEVMIPITDSTLFYKGFQFRFKNYATISGNVDQWNVDYVRLDRLRSFDDTLVDDIAFAYQTGPLLKNFRQMPWRHFVQNPPAQMKDTLRNYISNLSDTLKNISYAFDIFDVNGANIHSYNGGGENIEPFYSSGYHKYPAHATPPVSYVFPADTLDSAYFEIRHVLRDNSNPASNKWNDTVRFRQEFYDYYAYDDGTAENGYGLNVIGGMIAYRFSPAKSDTLRGVYMYFNRMLVNVYYRTFKLVVWNDAGGQPGSIIYQQDSLDGDMVRPHYRDSLNGFYFYRFNTPLYITAPFYVGWIQNTKDLLNIGLDRNTNSTGNMFYNIAGVWYNSLITGSWMIRPVFGEPLPPDVNAGLLSPREETSGSILVSPNPSGDYIRIDAGPGEFPAHRYSSGLYDLAGNLVLSYNAKGNAVMDVRNLPAGLYFLKIEDKASGFSTFRKVAVVH